MAKRPIFIPNTDPAALVDAVPVAFTWHPGFSPAQKKKNMRGLHFAAKKCGLSPLLEVSTKSDAALGRRLSAFNLRVLHPEHGAIPLEAAYQGSKVFTDGGPYTDLYRQSAWAAKTDARLRASGALTGFTYCGKTWALEPKTAFYDWLYLSAMQHQADDADALCEYAGFTDIEFNPAPKKSVNCQAHACALLVSLLKSGRLQKALHSPQDFLAVLGGAQQAAPNRANLLQASTI